MIYMNAVWMCASATLIPPLTNHPSWINPIPFGVTGFWNDAGTEWTEFENDICPFFCPKPGLEYCDPGPTYSLVCDLNGAGTFVDPSALFTFYYEEATPRAATTPPTYRAKINSINPDVIGNIPGEVTYQCKLAGTLAASTVYSN